GPSKDSHEDRVRKTNTSPTRLPHFEAARDDVDGIFPADAAACGFFCRPLLFARRSSGFTSFRYIRSTNTHTYDNILRRARLSDKLAVRPKGTKSRWKQSAPSSMESIRTRDPPGCWRP